MNKATADLKKEQPHVNTWKSYPSGQWRINSKHYNYVRQIPKNMWIWFKTSTKEKSHDQPELTELEEALGTSEEILNNTIMNLPVVVIGPGMDMQASIRTTKDFNGIMLIVDSKLTSGGIERGEAFIDTHIPPIRSLEFRIEAVKTLEVYNIQEKEKERERQQYKHRQRYHSKI